MLGLARAAGDAVHFRTRAGIVRHDLLFQPGDPCDPARLAESARVLRSEPYIRQADVTATPTADGGVDVLVVTRDEWSLRVDGRVGGGGFAVPLLRLADENLLGRAIRLQLRYDLLGRRPAYDGDVTVHHFLGRYEAQVIGGRSSVGPIGEERLLEPFKSEFDRVAWRESARYRKEPFSLVSPTLGRVQQPLVAVSGDVGAAARAGSPGHLVLGGLALSGERLLIEGEPFAPSVAGDSAAAAALAGRFVERRRVRLHLFVGARALRFSPHFGLDAVHAVQDAREGIEAGVVVGKSLFGGGGLQCDWFGSAELFAGADLAPVLAFVRAKVEGRYLLSGERWNGVLADARATVYAATGPRSVVVLSAAGAGGWHTTTPFQLLLGGPDGIRGYGLATLPVGRRVVVQAEERSFLGSVGGAVDLGAAAFVDVGRGWAGDAPFGGDTGLRAALGAGLRLAAPRGSRRTYRLDVAVPMTRGRGVEVQLALNQQFGVFRGEPFDVARSREQVSSATIFDYPRF